METVYLVCTTVQLNSKHGLSFQKLLTLIRKEFKKQGFDISIKSITKKYLGREEFYVNAYYDAEDDSNKETPIEVIIYHNFDKEVNWDLKHINSLLIQVFDAVVHEYKHQRQRLETLAGNSLASSIALGALGSGLVIGFPPTALFNSS